MLGKPSAVVDDDGGRLGLGLAWSERKDVVYCLQTRWMLLVGA